MNVSNNEVHIYLIPRPGPCTLNSCVPIAGFRLNSFKCGIWLLLYYFRSMKTMIKVTRRGRFGVFVSSPRGGKGGLPHNGWGLTLRSYLNFRSLVLFNLCVLCLKWVCGNSRLLFQADCFSVTCVCVVNGWCAWWCIWMKVFTALLPPYSEGSFTLQ